MIKNYSQLIFSNYDNLELCIETNNEYNYKYCNNYIRSKYNEQFNSLNNLRFLASVTLTFGHYFD